MAKFVKMITAAVLFLGSVSADVCAVEDRTVGEYNYWGAPNCFQLCGNCANDVICDEATGNCPEKACAEGWKGEKCDEPICDEKLCGKGLCVAPNKCTCPSLLAQYKKGDDKIGCYSLRADGIKGAFLAMGILIVSIVTCWGIGKHTQKSA
ncbi:Oidioi.mRNA.OKI2018_I69.PAR.g11894.t1.cds [Oikopleura dioica]|uniref:Oidioi.mRNA.OKI2018_I69.PAR.g11894.t1.cds n=1 Tax=Oikopleura dioica TaxID=34765 RepID=A0ABN7S0V8_OIKDI|nr:Oidioi.mRNA.OKI2018_I69.PAR.g11894.t1.cds [Oikopleura dioica]